MKRLSGAPTDLTTKKRGKKRKTAVNNQGFFVSLKVFKIKYINQTRIIVERRLTTNIDLRYPNAGEKNLINTGYKGK